MSTDVTGWYDVTRQGPQSDYSTSITNCLTSISNAGGGVLYFPPGSFPFSGSFTLPANTTVMGCGMGTTTLESSNKTSPVFTIPVGTGSAPSNSVITGLSLTWSTLPTTSEAIYVDSANFVTITDIEIVSPFTGITIGGSAPNGTHSQTVVCERVKIDMSESYNGGQAGIYVTGGPPGENQELHFSDCDLTGSTTAGSVVSAYGYWFENASGIFMSNCSASGFTYGLIFYPRTLNGDGTYSVSFNALVENCAFDNNGSACFLGSHYSQGSLYALMLTGCRFSGSVTKAGLICNSTVPTIFSGIGISGCNFSGNAWDGLDLNGCKEAQITGCAIYGNGQAGTNKSGITLASCSDVVISGCSITGSGGSYTTATQEYGISMTSCTKVLIQSCDLTGNLSASSKIDSDAGSLTGQVQTRV